MISLSLNFAAYLIMNSEEKLYRELKKKFSTFGIDITRKMNISEEIKHQSQEIFRINLFFLTHFEHSLKS